MPLHGVDVRHSGEFLLLVCRIRTTREYELSQPIRWQCGRLAVPRLKLRVVWM